MPFLIHVVDCSIPCHANLDASGNTITHFSIMAPKVEEQVLAYVWLLPDTILKQDGGLNYSKLH